MAIGCEALPAYRSGGVAIRSSPTGERIGSGAVLALLFPGQGSQRPQMGVPWQDHPAWERRRRACPRPPAGTWPGS